MENFDSPGKVVTLTAPSGGVVSGTLYLIGSLVVCALVTAAENAKFAGLVEGTQLVAKTTGQTWSEGEKLYYVTSTKKLSTSSGGNTLCGVATAAALSGAETGYARLDGVAR